MKCEIENCPNSGETICKSCKNEIWLCIDHAFIHFSDHKKTIERLSNLQRLANEIEKEKMCIINHYSHLITKLKQEMNSTIKEFSRLNANLKNIEELRRVTIDTTFLRRIIEDIRSTCTFRHNQQESNALKPSHDSIKLPSSEIREAKEEGKTKTVKMPSKPKKIQFTKTLNNERISDPVENPVDKQKAITRVNEKVVKVKFPENITSATCLASQRYLLFCNNEADCKQDEGHLD